MYRRIRNTARFLLANLHDFDPKEHTITENDMLALDRWIVDRASRLQDEILHAYEKYQFHTIVQKVHNFCVDDLGGFYLDVIKDRQYTGKQNGIPRRSAQTAIYYIAEAFVRWIAPILSFTAEEIWQLLPNVRENSVFLTDWYKGLPKLPDDSSMGPCFWEKVLQVRTAVNKEIENLRNKGIIGAALEVEVDLYCDKESCQLLTTLDDELKFVLITSAAKVYLNSNIPEDAVDTELSGLKLKINGSKHAKCERCWHRNITVNTNADFPGVCVRCVENLQNGEKRFYA